MLFEIQNWKIRDIFCKDSLLPSSKLYLKKLHSIQTRKGEQNSKAWKLKKMPGYAEFQWHTSKYPILLKTLDIDGAFWNSKLDIVTAQQKPQPQQQNNHNCSWVETK